MEIQKINHLILFSEEIVNMRKYLALIKGGFLEGIAYKENFLTGLLANFVQVVVFYYVWKSIFLYHTEINGYTWEIMKNM